MSVVGTDETREEKYGVLLSSIGLFDCKTSRALALP
jgi:hypothetical protein